jgi:hypothetical protein
VVAEAVQPNPAPLELDVDDPAAAAPLRELDGLVRAAGGTALPGTVLSMRAGDLTVRRSAPAIAATPLIAVPAACMPPVAAFRVQLRRGRLVCSANPEGPVASGLQERAFARLIDLYNVLGKPRQWAHRSPWLTLWDDPQLIDHLVQGTRGPVPPKPYTLYRAGRWEALLVESFLAARIYGAGAFGERRRHVLLPLLDALDHDARAGGFEPQGQGPARPAGLCVGQSQPIAGSDACYVAYRLMDARTALLHYGFPDASAPCVLAVTGSFELAAGLRLAVLPGAARRRGPLPQGQAALGDYLPDVSTAPPDVLAVRGLPLPPARAHELLPAVLDRLIADKRPDWPATRRAAVAQTAARRLYAVNRRYHARTADLLAQAWGRGERGGVPGRRAMLRALADTTARAGRHLAGGADAAG